MRYQSWRHFLNSKIHRMRNKFTNWFGLNSPLSSIYNGAKCKATGARLRQFQKQNFLKTIFLHKQTTKRSQSNSSLNVMVSSSEIETSADKINELMELSHQHDMLRAEQIHLEKEIKKRITVLIKAMHRHRRGTKKLQELEQLISEYIAEIEAPVSDYVIGSTERCASKTETVQVPASNQLIRLHVERNVGGHDKSNDFYYDFMPVLVKRYASIRKLAQRWMDKVHVKRRPSSLDIYSAVSIQPGSSLERMVKPALTATFVTQGVRKSHPQIKELNTNAQIKRDMQDMKKQSVLDDGRRISPSLQSLLSGKEIKESAEGAAKEGNLKSTEERKQLKSKQSATSDIDKVGLNQRVSKRKGRKRRSSRKSLQSVNSDRVRKAQKGKIRKKARRRSRKSIDNADRDTSVRRRSQTRRRKGKKRISKLSKRSRRSSSQKSVDAVDASERERKESVSDSVGKKYKRISKAEKSLETTLANIDKADVKAKKSKRKSAQSNTSEHIPGETIGRKHKGKDMEDKSESNEQFSALEQYWGVPLRDDSTLQKLEKLNSLLDDLIVEEELKTVVSKRTLASRKMSTKPSKHELSDLQKLFILFKECQECQKKQQKENMQINESKYAAQSQKEYYNTIKNAAGMPDCLPDDSDYSFACSCNSFV